MGLKDFSKKLDKYSTLALDTAPIIYFIEANPTYEAFVNEAFQRIDQGEIIAFTSILTLTETLVFPLEKNLEPLAENYKKLLLGTSGISSLEITAPIAEKAAELRAKYSSKALKTPDAIQIATAMAMGCNAILTNDTGWRVVSEIEVLILEDYIEKQPEQ